MAEEVLTEEEMDALGELSNISMGSSTTALSALLQNKKVTIEMPRIEVINRSQALDDYERQCILVHINYSKGLEGGDILLLKPTDVMTMTDLMMGGDGTNNQGEVSDLQLSAISEAMNQMMGSAATSLSVMLNRAVDITPPETDTIDVESIKIFALGAASFCVATAGGLLGAKLMNVFLKEKINPMIGAAGVSAVPDSARVVEVEGQKYDPSNHLLMHAMAPNVSGVIGSAVAAGVMMSFLMM